MDDAVVVVKLSCLRQALLVPDRRPLQITAYTRHAPQIHQDVDAEAPVPQFAAKGEGLREERLCPAVIALIAHGIPEIDEGVGDTLPIADFPAQGQTLLLERDRPRVVAAVVGHAAEPLEG